MAAHICAYIVLSPSGVVQCVVNCHHQSKWQKYSCSPCMFCWGEIPELLSLFFPANGGEGVEGSQSLATQRAKAGAVFWLGRLGALPVFSGTYIPCVSKPAPVGGGDFLLYP